MTIATVVSRPVEADERPLPLREWARTSRATERNGLRAHPATDGIVGRFRSGRLVGTTPEELDSWRVTTAHPSVATALANRLGGAPAEWLTTGEDHLEVLTDAPVVRIILDGPTAITSALTLGAQGNLGSPQPSTTILFRLDGALDLGVFQLRSSSWELAETVSELQDRLFTLEGAALCELALQCVEFTTRSGDHIAFKKPVVTFFGRHHKDRN